MKKKYILIFECGDGSLQDFLDDESNQNFFTGNFENVKSFYSQIYSALLYLRIHKISHRDLKPANIIYFNPSNINKN